MQISQESLEKSMKNHEIDAPVNALRRRLFLGAPAGLMLAGPWALLGCGGSEGDAATTSSASADSLHDSGRAFAGTTDFTDVAVAVDVPAGVTVPPGGIAAHTILGGFGVVRGGSATLRLAFAGPQLATLYTADGLPLLFGFVGAGLPAISARSTATVLIAFAIGTEWVEGSANQAWIAEVQASDAARIFGDVIATALVADVYALAGGSAAIDSGLAAAVRTLLSTTRAATIDARRSRPLGISVNPPNAASGVQPIVADGLNTLYVQNEKLRRAWYVMRREGATGADGVFTADPLRPSVAEGDIPMLPGFDSASSIIGSLTEANYSGDDTSLAFSKTPDTQLILTPEGARNTTYSVTVLMAGNPAIAYDPVAFGKLSATEKLKIDISLFSPEHLGLRTLVIDHLVPLFLTWLGGKVSEQGQVGPREHKQKIQVALLSQLLGVMKTTIPAVVAKLQDAKNYPTYGVGGALIDIVRNHLIDLVAVSVPGRAQPVSVPVLSSFSITIITLLLKYLAYERLNAANGEALLNFLESKFVAGDENMLGERLYSWNAGKDKDGKDKFVHFDKENLGFLGVGVAAKALGTVDAILGNVSKLRAFGDKATSKLLETWEVKTTKPKLRLSPNPFEVDPIGGTFALHAEIVDNDNDAYGVEKGSFSYDWVCVARFGDLFKRNAVDGAAQEKNTFTTSNANATADFVPNGKTPDGGAPDTIKVTIYFEPIGSKKPREVIGTVSTTVIYKKPFSLAISPPGITDFPTASEMTVTAFFKEKLPAGSTVAWQWSHAGAGSIVALPADSNPADSKVKFQSGTAEGSATVTARATIDVPATAAKPSHFVITDPVSTTFNVKKGLTQITFLASGGTFACTDPKACGVLEYTAFIVPRFAKAVLYQAVLSGYSYASCNRMVTWTSPLGDGGGCNFPVSYFPHSSAGATDAWAVWIGFGGAISGKCEVTVTLAP